jgi:hypothetical protein
MFIVFCRHAVYMFQRLLVHNFAIVKKYCQPLACKQIEKL